MSRKNKRTGKPKGLSNSQVNFMIAQAMRSGAFKRISTLAKEGASREELKEAVRNQYLPKGDPDKKVSGKDEGYLEGHLEKLVDELVKRYSPKEENSEESPESSDK